MRDSHDNQLLGVARSSALQRLRRSGWLLRTMSVLTMLSGAVTAVLKPAQGSDVDLNCNGSKNAFAHLFVSLFTILREVKAYAAHLVLDDGSRVPALIVFEEGQKGKKRRATMYFGNATPASPKSQGPLGFSKGTAFKTQGSSEKSGSVAPQAVSKGTAFKAQGSSEKSGLVVPQAASKGTAFKLANKVLSVEVTLLDPKAFSELKLGDRKQIPAIVDIRSAETGLEKAISAQLVITEEVTDDTQIPFEIDHSLLKEKLGESSRKSCGTESDNRVKYVREPGDPDPSRGKAGAGSANSAR